MITSQINGQGGLFEAWNALLQGLMPQGARQTKVPPDDASIASLLSPAEMFQRALRSGEAAVAQALSRTSSEPLSTALERMFSDWGKAVGGLRPWPNAAGVPFSPGVEIAFGGLADALGLGPSRRLAAALQALSVAQAEQQQSWLRLQQLVVSRWPEVAQRTIARVVTPGDGASGPETVSDVLSLWAATADEVGHDALHGESGAQAMADCIRASTAAQAARNEVGEIVCEAMNLPTRRELDEAFLEIQKLKRLARAAPARPAVAPGQQGTGRPAPRKRATRAKPASAKGQR